jgi:hypothetical protein
LPERVVAQLVVRNLDDGLVARLKRQAAEHGRSAEAEHREILRLALAEEPRRSFKELAARVRAMTEGRTKARRCRPGRDKFTTEGSRLPSTLDSAETIVARLRAQADELRRAGIRHLSLFGSAARGEAGPESDIDLAAELDPEAHIGLIRLAGIENRLGQILGRKVDLLPEPVIKPRLRANIDRDRRRVF